MKIITNIYRDNLDIHNTKFNVELQNLRNNLEKLLDEEEKYGLYLLDNEFYFTSKRKHYMSLKKLKKIFDLDLLINTIKSSKDLTLEYGKLFFNDEIDLSMVHNLFRRIEEDYYCVINLIRMASKYNENNNPLFNSFFEEKVKSISLFTEPENALYLIQDSRIREICEIMIRDFLNKKIHKEELESDIYTYKKEIEKFCSKKDITTIEELEKYRDILKEFSDVISKNYCKIKQ